MYQLVQMLESIFTQLYIPIYREFHRQINKILCWLSNILRYRLKAYINSSKNFLLSFSITADTFHNGLKKKEHNLYNAHTVV